MDRYEGPARLEWWANRRTCLASVDVRVTVTADDSGWHTTASFVSPLTAEDREGWNLLMTASPYCTLRFKEDEEAAIDVLVSPRPAGSGRADGEDLFLL